MEECLANDLSVCLTRRDAFLTRSPGIFAARVRRYRCVSVNIAEGFTPSPSHNTSIVPMSFLGDAPQPGLPPPPGLRIPAKGLSCTSLLLLQLLLLPLLLLLPGLLLLVSGGGVNRRVLFWIHMLLSFNRFFLTL